MKQTTEERFWAKVDKNGPGGCWLWTAGTSKGYGQFLNGAHRVSYEMLVGPIPEGLHIDHLCRVRACVNPDHLEPVTRKENILRGVGAPAVNARKTHCSQGHPYNDENTYAYTYANGKESRRDCRACQRERKRQSRLRLGRH